jgi:hypothetical protein
MTTAELLEIDQERDRLTKEDARARYRAAWTMWLTSRTDDDRRIAEKLMDEAQPGCAEGGRPGPDWDEFKATLPGYNAHWQGNRDEMNRMGREMFGDLWRGI